MVISKKHDRYCLEVSLEELLDIKEALAVRIYAAQEYTKGEFAVPPYLENHKKILGTINWWIHGERE